MINWYKNLINFLSPSIIMVNGSPTVNGVLPTNLASKANLVPKVVNNPQQSIAPIANYIANPFTSAQLAQVPFHASPSMLQAYQAKMQGYGIAPQPFAGSPQVGTSPAPVKGGK